MTTKPMIYPDPALYARIVDQMGHSVILIDGSRWVRYVSRSLARQLGEPPEALIHTRLYELCPGLPQSWMEDQFAQLVHAEGTHSETVRWRVRSSLFQPLTELQVDLTGSRMYYQCELFMLQGGAEPLFCFTLDGPVPESGSCLKDGGDDMYREQMVHIEQQLLHSEKLATLGQLVAGVAHEINNPVCYVKTNLQTLKQYAEHMDRLLGDMLVLAQTSDDTRLTGELSRLKQALDYDFIHDELPLLLDETVEGVQRIEGIISTLRDYARHDADEGQWVDLNALLDAALKLVHHELKYVVTAVRRDYARLPKVWCRPAQLSQVVINLLVNAAQAMPAGGDIEIETRLLDGEETVEISICDRGEGIAEDVMAVLFDPFVTTKPPGKGTGLGLSVSKQIISSHRGQISARNRAGGGACFRICLPLGDRD